MPDYVRSRHRTVGRALEALNGAVLQRNHCYFGGGTRIVMELDEYRESADIDFLCSDVAGYRALRSGISQKSLGSILNKKSRVSLPHEVRADQYGIRTVLGVGDETIKFEIILEARIKVTGTRVAGIPAPTLDRASCFAEKWLANADRWNDTSVSNRDAIDLSFMLRAWGDEDARIGADIASTAYGKAIGNAARAAAEKLLGNAEYRRHCIRNLAVDDANGMLSGLKRLHKFAAALP